MDGDPYNYTGSGPEVDSPSYSNSGSSGNQSDPKTNYGYWNGDYLGYLNYMASQGDSASIDKLMNYLMSEDSADRARRWTASREDTQYQRLVADLKASGLNPYLLMMNGASAISSSSDGRSYSGSQYLTQQSNKETARHNQEAEAKEWLKALISMIPIAVMMALI